VRRLGVAEQVGQEPVELQDLDAALGQRPGEGVVVAGDRRDVGRRGREQRRAGVVRVDGAQLGARPVHEHRAQALDVRGDADARAGGRLGVVDVQGCHRGPPLPEGGRRSHSRRSGRSRALLANLRPGPATEAAPTVSS
jgi:hypothetical protein